MNKEQRDIANENAVAYRFCLDKAVIYAECLNMACNKEVVIIEPLYEKLMQAQSLVLKGVENYDE